MKIEMTRYELSFVLKLVGDYVIDLAESIRRRKKLGEDVGELEKHLDEIDPLRQRLYRAFIENCGGTNNEENTDFD